MTEGTRPAPYPPDTRAKGWRFELDYEQIDQSDTWGLAAEVPMAQHALLMMWLVAWRQEPCGSFPNDETVIRAKCRIPPRVWAQCRELMMRGWWLAEDGRLYHDTIAARVLEMLATKKRERERKAEYRARQSQGDPAMSHGTTTGQTSDSGGKDGTGTSNTSSSSLRSEEHPPKPPRKRRGDGADAPTVSATQLVAEGVAEQHAKDWLTVRKTKKLPLTATAWDEVKAEAVLAGMTAAEAVHKAVVNGWGGFKAKWLLEDAPAAASSPPAQSFAERDRIAGMERWEQMTGKVHPDRAPPAKRLSDVIDEPLQTLAALGAPA